LPRCRVAALRTIVRSSFIVFVEPDGSERCYGAGYDGRRLRWAAGRMAGSFQVNQPDPTHLTLDGVFESKNLHVETTRLSTTDLPLLNSSFHWVQEYPVNR
jgi:hypothetical protein